MRAAQADQNTHEWMFLHSKLVQLKGTAEKVKLGD